MSEDDSKLMTMKEARSFLHVSNTTIRRWVAEGKLPTYKTEGGHWSFFYGRLINGKREIPGRQKVQMFQF